jgi:hypothetical protein
MAGGMLLQSAATDAGNGNVARCFGISGEYVGTVITSDAATTAGDVTFEHAITTAGPWEALGPAVAADRNTIQSFRFRGAFEYIRGRISNAITGGSNVTVRIKPPEHGET